MPARALKVLAFNCSLKSAGGREKSSTDILLQQLLDALAKHGAKGDIIRAVDHDIKPGVKSDEGEGDAWPALCKRVVEADIVVIGTPIWLGQPSSVAKRVLERMDAFLDETDEQGRMLSYGRVAAVAVVGNEDGADRVGIESQLAHGDQAGGAAIDEEGRVAGTDVERGLQLPAGAKSIPAPYDCKTHDCRTVPLFERCLSTRRQAPPQCMDGRFSAERQ